MNGSGQSERPTAPSDLVERYTAAGWWGTETLREVLARHSATNPDGVAIISADERSTWAEYERQSSELAAAMVAAGLRPGERVAVMVPDGPLVHELFAAGEKAGLIVMAIGPRAGAREVAHLVGVSEASTIVTASGHRDDELPQMIASMRSDIATFQHHLVVDRSGEYRLDGQPLRRPSGDLVALLDGLGPNPNELFFLNSTSGTTGLPKCVMHNQNRWFYFHQLAAAAGGLDADDVFMSVVSAPFGFGIWTSHVTPLLLGVPTVVMPRFSTTGMIREIERHRVTVLCAVSTQFVMLLNSPELEHHDLSSLRVMFTGGEAVPIERAREFEARTGAKVLQFYGSNETGALSVTSLTDGEHARLTTAGKPIDDMQVRLIDADGGDVTATGGPGQPICLGPATCLGYYADEAANAKLVRPDGWMTTGDIATIEDGYLKIVGRTSDIIIRGGKNISAGALEDEVLTYPTVALAAAVAVPDPVFGERVCIVVSTTDGSELELDDLNAHLDERGVTKEWWPEYLLMLDDLPKASGGKIAKSELRKLAAAAFAAT